MKCCVLSSGSKANCTYIETKDLKLLIDCGLSCKQCEKILSMIGVLPNSLDAILVTHSHIDHIKGIPLLSNKYKIPVWCTRDTLRIIKDAYDPTIIDGFESHKVKDTTIETAFASHDVTSCLSYKIKEGGFKLAYLTDTGIVSNSLKDFLRDVNALILEFNHDPIMLQVSDYNWNLKKRIASTLGHLSNKQACDLLKEIYHKDLKTLFLAHLSENTNTPEIALNEAKKTLDTLGQCNIVMTGYFPSKFCDFKNIKEKEKRDMDSSLKRSKNKENIQIVI